MDWKAIWVPQISPWEVIFRAAVVFLFVQLSFRILGRREWTRYSAFNVSILFLIAVALRTSIVGNDTSVASGFIALSTILTFDWIFSYASFRSRRISRWLNGPVLPIIKNGQVDFRQLRRARLSHDLLLSELRLRGCWCLEHVEEAYIESNGNVSFKFKENFKSNEKPHRSDFAA